MSQPTPDYSTGIVILLIDDDPDCRQLVRDALELGGICNPVYETSSGLQGLEFLQRAGTDPACPRPGLIYLDVEMPGLNGLETLRQIRAQTHLVDIPIVMLTGVTDDDYKRQALEHGANSFTNKPVDARQFVQTVMETTLYWTRIHQRPSPTITTHVPPAHNLAPKKHPA